MFGFSDIPKFILAFFLVMPLISILHEFGHVFFAWMFGGKNIKVSIGTGKPIFKMGMLEIRKYYFWYGLCTFENLRRNHRFGNILIFGGGTLFNSLGIVGVLLLVKYELLETGMFTYQFTYFSMYYIFFALLPMPYPDGNYSDGKIILDLLRNKQTTILARTYRIKWNKDAEEFYVVDHEEKLLNSFREEEEAVKAAKEMAQQNRPSRVLWHKEGKDEEIQNFPRIPL